ncbi:hypothetical protein CLU79DRAFT_706980 [Phycomyces nitens]|nr:hypothetical protein CLU79DRAFT_706980 [Phycomyces nitens]
MLLISHADQYIGQCIASHLARHKPLRESIRILCQDRAQCSHLEKNGIDVRQLDYQHPNQLSLAMRNIDCLLLAVGNEPDRVENCKKLCQSAVKSGAKSIVLISHIGALSLTHEGLCDYGLIEEEVFNVSCQWTILRLDWITQYFHLWAPFVEKHRYLPLPISAEVEICPIDIQDVCEVIESMTVNKDTGLLLYNVPENYGGQTYILSGPESLNGQQIANLMASTTGYKLLVYRNSRAMDLSHYLKTMAKDIWFDARLKQERNQAYHSQLDNHDYASRAFGSPSASLIQEFIDYFDWISKTASSVCVSHATVIRSNTPRSVEDFFTEHANSFKPRV